MAGAGHVRGHRTVSMAGGRIEREFMVGLFAVTGQDESSERPFLAVTGQRYRVQKRPP